MTTVNVYLSFNGECREAFEFYKTVFKKNFSYLGTYGEMPQQEGQPPLSEDLKEQIMHVSLPISSETALMGSDAGGAWSKTVIAGNNFTISVNNKDKEEAERIFRELSDGGQIIMPFEKTFWQAWYGMFTDRFGINWMVNCELAEHEAYEQSRGK